MKYIIIFGTIVLLACIAGCVDSNGTANGAMPEGASMNITSGGQSFPAYFAAPGGSGPYPGVVLIHSFNGLEPGYESLVEQFAAEGFVVIAPEWQTFEKSPSDDVVEMLIRDSVAYLGTRSDVDMARLGLTGFCAGGRYTMLFLPQIEEFKSGVAWYGFPYYGGFNNETLPASLVGDIADPLLIIHGTRDTPSPVADIYRYVTELDEADAYFELKVYQGELHGFMIVDGMLSESFVAQDAYREMVSFFTRTLG
ncbi:dienelactone hydrolase family protein [Methanogenium marinum]|uniref:Dienelactone hydrolase family protein n=1 Tax=Methanogenium marinum TaxID=348610 RepID=A0A9Q4PV74_9EURY|nr:dienelactone hydrolase family protein [Methanogenium marinum]MDE4907705.1 dienelactone hydrolase family protein [Methanogenium marinum]